MSMIRVGCCGFQKSQNVYFHTFRLIEVQQTFYRLPKVETVQRWRATAPDEFVFTLKALQLITHEPYQPTYRRYGPPIPRADWDRYGSFRPTEEVLRAWEETREQALLLRAPVVVFQCPQQFTPTDEHVANLRQFMRSVDRGGMRFAFEPRGAWEDELIARLCADLDLIHCADPFIRLPVFGSPGYLRLHGGADYQHQFSDAELDQVAGLCQQMGDVYCLFNNVPMWEDALRFRERIGDPYVGPVQERLAL